MSYSFKLTLDRGTQSPIITVEDLSTEGLPPAKLELSSGAELPYQLAVDQAAGSKDRLLVRLSEPFDPQVTRDPDVLRVETFLSDHRFETWDDTKYILRITNKSRYYLAEDVRVHARINPAEQPRLPDGNVALTLTPHDQHIQCIDPGQTRELVFVAISRGCVPRLYGIDVTLAYRLLYWDGRRVRDASQHVLPVYGEDTCFEIPNMTLPALMPRQPSLARSNDMSDERQQKTFFAPLPTKPRHRHLKPIEQHFPLPGGGRLGVSYRLLKGHPRGSDDVPCSYGRHPESGEIESYFSTQDTATLEVTLDNESHSHLKHVRLSEIQLVAVDTERQSGGGVMDTLPDGNFLFEVVPSDVYFGHLSPHEKTSKYLSLITRGIKAGHYAVKVRVHYDIEQCHLPVDLWLTVRPD
jgi:hypothetical protein